MAYDITSMRSALQRQIAPLYPDRITGERIGEAFRHMRISNDRLAERQRSKCLIPRISGNGDPLENCNNATANSHAIQEKVLLRIATEKSGKN